MPEQKTGGKIILEFLASGSKRALIPFDGRKNLRELLRKAAYRAGEVLKFATEKGKGVHIVRK